MFSKNRGVKIFHGDSAVILPSLINQIKTPTLSEIIRISREFAEKSELLKSPEVINQIREIEESGGNASMIMLGNAVYSDVEFVGCERIEVSKRRACLIE